MKLNNRGWGLGVFLIFLAMFFLILLLVASLIDNFSENFYMVHSNETIILDNNKKDIQLETAKELLNAKNNKIFFIVSFPP